MPKAKGPSGQERDEGSDQLHNPLRSAAMEAKWKQPLYEGLGRKDGGKTWVRCEVFVQSREQEGGRTEERPGWTEIH